MSNLIKEAIDICDVHYWALGDSTKRFVKYCSTCDAWICEECEPKVLRRVKAATNRLLTKWQF